jgi:hypothetical protein
MASWEDGPEYAPIERPDGFSVPAVAPLSVAEPYVQPAADAPIPRPVFGTPQAPVRPLAELVPVGEEPRDPTLPYDIASAAMTGGDSAWGAVHYSAPTSPITTSASPWNSAVAGAAPTVAGGTTAAPWVSPTAPIQPSGGLPAPGTPQWFGPGPFYPPPAPAPVTAKDAVAALTPAMLIVLLLGGLISPVAPITLIIAWGLSSRCTVAKLPLRVTFVVAVAALAVIGLIIGFVGALDFADWWNGLSWFALVITWCVAVAAVIIVVRALRAGERPRPPIRPSTGTGPWG